MGYQSFVVENGLVSGIGYQSLAAGLVFTDHLTKEQGEGFHRRVIANPACTTLLKVQQVIFSENRGQGIISTLRHLK
ncbi:hypothetical protein E1189_04115 [Sansalvadorimonas verongulae]|nr:hypothetical protein [Sansalvadorimonas verongulae]